MVIKRGIIQSFNASSYTASVLLFEATSHHLSGVPVATSFDGTSGLVGALCAVLFFDAQNPQDAVVIAAFPNGTNGLPSPSPGRVSFVTGFRQINNVAITSGATQTFTLVGSGGIPTGALGVIYKASFTSATAGASLNLAPHAAADVTAYATLGNLPNASGVLNGGGILQLDGNGQIDIKANAGACTVTLYTHGYVV